MPLELVEREVIEIEPEFSLRDRFAMQYMKWVACDWKDKRAPSSDAAMLLMDAYRYADLAMKAREPRDKEVPGD